MVPQPLLLPSPSNSTTNKMATTTAPPTAPTNTNNIATTANHHKKHTRHHVKRRSTGRVHVTKLAPMARANASAHTDTEADDHDHTSSTKRPHMRRSQSQRSLNRLSSFERKGGMTAMAPLHPPQPTKNTAISNNNNNNNTNASTISPPTTPPLQAEGKQQQQQRSLPPPSSSSSSSSSSSEEMEIKKQRRPERNVGEDQENTCPTPSVSSPAVLRNNSNNSSSKSTQTTTSKPFILSQRGPAAPIEQTFNAVANNLVAPDKAALPAFHKQATSPSKSPSSQSDSHATKKRMPPLRSQFIDEHSRHHTNNNLQQQHPETVASDSHHPQHSNSMKRSNMEKTPRQSNVASAATAQPPGISRTQQKLLLQRQHCLVDDENNLGHPRNMLRLTRELERVGREYRCVRRYRDPMLESLQRCISAEQQEHHQHHPHHPHRLQANHRTRSSSVLPSSSTAGVDHADNDHPIPHSEQRQAIHRRQQQLKLLAMANNHSNSSNSGNHRHSMHTYSSGGMHSSSHQQQQQPNTALDMIRWSAGALLDRVWYGSNGSS